MMALIYRPEKWGGAEEARVIRAVGIDDGGIVFVHRHDVERALRERLREVSERAKVSEEKVRKVLERMLGEGESVLIFEIT